MHCLSVRQPFASWIATGLKTIELRTWAVRHRGDIAIHASKHGDPSDGLPRGVVLCVVRIEDIRPAVSADDGDACCEVPDGCMAWVLRDVRQVEPFHARGNAGLFTVPDGALSFVAGPRAAEQPA